MAIFQTVVNISSKSLAEANTSVLAKGLNVSISPKVLHVREINHLQYGTSDTWTSF